MEHFLAALAARLLRTLGPGRRLVAVDGVDGSGKTSFAAGLAHALRARPVVVIHLDDFLNPAPIRHAQGRASARGFWEDSYNYGAFHKRVLAPLGPHGDGWYSPASYDPQQDTTVPARARQAPSNALILVEGMFLQRAELAAHWDAAVFLDVPFAETAARMARRNGSHPDPNHVTMRRYVGGQRLYFQAARPWERATVVIDNSDFAAPSIITPCEASALQAVPPGAPVGDVPDSSLCAR